MRTLPTAVLTSHRTVLGPMLLAATDNALLLSAFDDGERATARLNRGGFSPVGRDAATRSQLRIVDETARQLDTYLEGRRRSFDVPTDLCLATPFSRATVERLDALLPYGSTATYAELATALDRPQAARAVGTALGSNPLCVVLPCHRVVGAGGRVTGYAGGILAKQFLLDLESGRPSRTVS